MCALSERVAHKTDVNKELISIEKYVRYDCVVEKHLIEATTQLI